MIRLSVSDSLNGGSTMKRKAIPREIELPDHTYQPSKAEMLETVNFEGTLKQFAKALLQPVKVHRVKNWRKPR